MGAWPSRQRVCLSVGKALSSQVRVRDASFRVCSFSSALLMIYSLFWVGCDCWWTELSPRITVNSANYFRVTWFNTGLKCTHKYLCDLCHVLTGFVRKQQSLKARVYMRQTIKIFWSWAFGVLVSAFTFQSARRYHRRFASEMRSSVFVRPVFLVPY